MTEKELASAGKKWQATRERERAAAASMYEAIKAAREEGMTEVHIAAVVGVDRMTVRRALGKL